MKRCYLAGLAVASAALLSACGTPAIDQGPATRVSPDYEARGDTNGMRAYVYGQRTVLELTGDPTVVYVTDANGVKVPFERVGRYYRLSRKGEHFSVRANWRSAVFHLVPPQAPMAVTPVPPALPTVQEPVAKSTLPPVKLIADVPAASPEFKALVAAAQQQLEEVRQIVKSGARDTTDWQDIASRLDRIEAQLARASSAVVMVYFDSYKSEFLPPARLGQLIVSAAKNADAVNLRGRTDAVIPGVLDAGIAQARAESVRRYLVEHGVKSSKISVASLAAGEFIGPKETARGRAINRRVEVEIVSKRLAAAIDGTQQVVQANSDSAR